MEKLSQSIENSGNQILSIFKAQFFAPRTVFCELVLQRMVVRVEVRVRAAIQQAVSARE